MNVTLPETKMDFKSKMVYIAIIGVCIISIILVLCAQFLEWKPVTTVGNLKGKSDEGYEELKAEFVNLFSNSLQSEDDEYENIKEDKSKPLVYTEYENKVNVDGSYDLDINLPYINIKNNDIKKYNEEIKSAFKTKVDDILKTKNRNSIYTLGYSAYIQDNILSVVIRGNLKEGANAQRVFIKTYNYNLKENKEVTLADVIKLENVDKNYVQGKIDTEIKTEQKKAEDLKALGYTIFERDSSNEMYRVDNVEEFYLHDGSIYIIFAYGNSKHTSEVDIAII